MNEKIYRKYLRENISEEKIRRLYHKIKDRCNYVHEDYKTYNGMELKWKKANDFIDWFFNVQTSYRLLKEHNKKHEYQLDKDLKGKGYYGSDACIFIPKYINAMIETRMGARGDLLLGVCNGRNGFYSVYISVMGKGSHTVVARTVPDIHTAFHIYRIAKEHYIKLIAEEYYKRDLIDDEAYNLLMNYKVTDDTGKAKYDDQYIKYANNYLTKSDKLNMITDMVNEFSVPEIIKMKDNVLEVK